MERKLTLISAPAGYGKTTLLCQWLTSLAGADVPVAWVSLDEEENDPVRFWNYVSMALGELHHEEGEGTLDFIQSAQSPPSESILIPLINALSTLQKHFALVLDDYHLITDPAIHDALTFLLHHMPSHMHLIMASRFNPSLHLSRLRARGQVIEVCTDDLRFTSEEGAAFLREVMELNLSQAEMTMLVAGTEGWIAGLQLAGLSMQRHEPIRGEQLLSIFAARHRSTFDFLAHEVFMHQPERMQTFLL